MQKKNNKNYTFPKLLWTNIFYPKEFNKISKLRTDLTTQCIFQNTKNEQSPENFPLISFVRLETLSMSENRKSIG